MKNIKIKFIDLKNILSCFEKLMQCDIDFGICYNIAFNIKKLEDINKILQVAIKSLVDKYIDKKIELKKDFIDTSKMSKEDLDSLNLEYNNLMQKEEEIMLKLIPLSEIRKFKLNCNIYYLFDIIDDDTSNIKENNEKNNN